MRRAGRIPPLSADVVEGVVTTTVEEPLVAHIAAMGDAAILSIAAIAPSHAPAPFLLGHVGKKDRHSNR